MLHCHKCGQRIQNNCGVQRSLQTGNYSGGTAYYRKVNLCSRCSNSLLSTARSARITKTLMVLAGVVIVLAGSAYLLYGRP